MKVNFFRVVLSALALTSLTACGTVSGWLEDDTYVAPPAELTEFTPEFEPQVLWSTDTGDGAEDNYSKLSVKLYHGMVIAVDAEGKVSSYQADSGKSLWSTKNDVTVVAGVGAGDDTIYIGTVEGEIIALGQNDGQVKWKQKLTSEVLVPPNSDQGVVVVRTADGRMSGLSAEDGHVLWNYQRTVPLLSLRGVSAPALADGKVVAGYANGKLVALSITDGTVLWEKSVAVPRGRSELDRLVDIDADPVIADGTIYVVAYHGRLAAIRLETGDLLWQREMSSHTGLDVEPYDAVYISDEDDYVWSIQDGSGDGLWRQTRLIRRSITAPAIVGDNVIIGDFEGYVHWLSRQDGRFVARKQLADSAIISKPVVADGIAYIIAKDGKLTALKVQ